MRGVYVLIIEVRHAVKFRTRSGDEIVLEPGEWVYIGSAMGSGSTNLENRLRRHFRKEKTNYWHIDYLIDEATKIKVAIWAESKESVECDLAQSIANHIGFKVGPKGFGASDCQRGCFTHVYLYLREEMPLDIIMSIFGRLGLHPHITKNGQIS
ncbi:MAG: DUF123 domain-containing protein [Candidatus Thorarchaeota archaeon]